MEEIKIKRGRATKLTPERIEMALMLRDRGFSILEIANALNISEALLYKKNSDWEKLRHELNLRKMAQDAERVEKIEKSLYNRAKGYKTKEKKEQFDAAGNLEGYTITSKEVPADVKAQQFFLLNRAPNRWSAAPEESAGAAAAAPVIKIEIVEAGEK